MRLPTEAMRLPKSVAEATVMTTTSEPNQTISLGDLIRHAELNTPAKVAQFHMLRKRAFDHAQELYADRETSYNVDHEPTQEMPYGPVSLVSEMFKRVRRAASILSPLRRTELDATDLNRLLDTCTDTLNYTSWLYALIIMVKMKDES